MDSTTNPRSSFTIPNLITLMRILLTPLFIIFLIQGRYQKALIVFVLAGLSDMADGLIARHWQQKSPLGAYLDPVADKVLMASGFVALSIARLIPSWLTVMVLSRDVVLVVGVLVLRLAEYPVVVRPSLWGKLTATFQVVTVLLALVAKIWPLPPVLLNIWFILTGVLTGVSGIHYFFRGLAFMGQGQDRRGDLDGRSR